MLTATAGGTGVLPGMTLKAWVFFDNNVIVKSYNVSAVALIVAGMWNITFPAGTFSTVTYLAYGYADNFNGGTSGPLQIGNNSTRTATTAQITARNATGTISAANGGVYCAWYE